MIKAALRRNWCLKMGYANGHSNGDPNGSKILKILKSGQESLYCTMGGMNYQISRNSSYFELVLIGF